MQKLSAKWVPKCLNADQKRQWCQSSEQLLKFFLAWSKWFPVMIGDHGWNLYITMTRRQSNNQWSGGIAAHPAQKILSAKICWNSSRLDFLGSRRHPSHRLSFKGPDYQRGVLLISAGASEGYFEGNGSGNFTKGILFLHNNVPAYRAHATQKKWPTWASNVLITHRILQIWPPRATTCSLDWKNN